MAGPEILIELKYDLSLHQLDVEVIYEHLVNISRIIDDYVTLGIQLGLTEIELQDIQCNYRSQELRRSAMLRKWKQKYAWKATYHKLIKALLQSGRADLARIVCELLTQSKQP